MTFGKGLYMTRDGADAEVFRTDGGSGYCLLGAVATPEGWYVRSWTLDGRASVAMKTNHDDLVHPEAERLRIQYEINTHEKAITELWKQLNALKEAK